MSDFQTIYGLLKELRADLRLKEQLNKIESELRILKQEYSILFNSEARLLASELRQKVDKLEDDVKNFTPGER